MGIPTRGFSATLAPDPIVTAAPAPLPGPNLWDKAQAALALRDPVRAWEFMLKSQGIEPGPSVPPTRQVAGRALDELRASLAQGAQDMLARQIAQRAFEPPMGAEMPPREFRHTGVIPSDPGFDRTPTGPLQPGMPAAASFDRDDVDAAMGRPRRIAPPGLPKAGRPGTDLLGAQTGLTWGVPAPPHGEPSSAPTGVTWGMPAPGAAGAPIEPAAAAGAPRFDFGSANAADLRSRLAALDDAFPVRDRPYEIGEMVPTRNFRSLGHMKGTGAMNIRNPVTGQTVLAPPGATPEMMLDPANRMVRAKNRARADMIRGADVEQAMVQAFAEALGVDPSIVAGMTMEQAQPLLGPLGARVREGAAREEAAGRRTDMQQALEQQFPGMAAGVAGIQNPTDAMAIFNEIQQRDAMQRREQEERQKQADQQRTATSLAEAMQRLLDMDPEAAEAAAHSHLAPFVMPGSEQYGRVMNVVGARAERAREQRAADADQWGKAREQRQKRRETLRTERGRRIESSIIGPLREALQPVPKIEQVEAKHIGEQPREETRWREAAAKQIAGLRAAVAAAEADGIDLGAIGRTVANMRLDGKGGYFDESDPEGSAAKLSAIAAQILRQVRAASSGE